MQSLPNFPVPGTILTRSVSLDRISFALNTVPNNAAFPTGEYIFFGKNGSLFYKFRTPNGTWSGDILYIAGATGSNTKFDINGYPATAYLDTHNNIHVQYWLDDVQSSYTIGNLGTLPTIVTFGGDITVFYVPTSYAGALQYTQLCTRYSVSKVFQVGVPGTISNLQIEQLSDLETLMFAFESDQGQNGPNAWNYASRQVYVAFAKP